MIRTTGGTGRRWFLPALRSGAIGQRPSAHGDVSTEPRQPALGDSPIAAVIDLYEDGVARSTSNIVYLGEASA